MNLDLFRRYWLRVKELGLHGIFKIGFHYFINAIKNSITIPIQLFSYGITIFSGLCILSHYGLIPDNVVADAVNTYLSTSNTLDIIPVLFMISVLVLTRRNLHHFNYIENKKLKFRKAFSATMIQSIILIFGMIGALSGFALKAFPQAITNHLLFVGLSYSMLAIGLMRDRIARWIVQFY